MAAEGVTATATKSGAPDPLIGRVIAERFRITSLIARGGMGKVYQAEQSPLGRMCAIKVLNPNYNGDADPEFHRRFFREASITSRITHPNSVTIFDYGKTDDDVYYMAMEYLEGQTLHQAIREAGTFHEERVGRITQQICRALREAHALDVIHRDLKPANIFLTRHGDDEDFVKVLDFGLVKHLSERPEEQLTQTGLFMGSPKYMAPEQIQGGQVDARTDVYSLGIMMYEMLAGKVPFERPSSVNILMAHVGEPPPPMREVNPNLVCSPAFEELVMRCIAKDPAQRFTTMDAVLRAIKQVHGGSMTGQLQALSSGAYQPLATAPPPAVWSGTAEISGSGVAARSPERTSGSLTPPGMLRADGSGESGASYGEERPRRSRLWIGLGVVVAAVLGGLLGMAAFRMTSSPGPSASIGVPSSPVSKASAPSAPAEPSAAAPEVSTGAPAAAAVRVTTLRVTSDPPGATVREDATELCASTPCDHTFRGEAAEPSTTHRLVIAHPGYRNESRTFNAGEPTLHVKLSRSSGGGRPTVTAPATRPATPDTTTPSGFKDLPY